MTTVARARELHDQGLTNAQIAERLGKNLSYIKRCTAPNAYKRSLAKSREDKRSRVGTCSECGAETRYAGAQGRAVSDRCVRCAQPVGIATRRERYGYGTIGEQILALLRERPMRVSEIADALGQSRNNVHVRIHRFMYHDGIVERVSRGVYRATI